MSFVSKVLPVGEDVDEPHGEDDFVVNVLVLKRTDMSTLTCGTPAHGGLE